MTAANLLERDTESRVGEHMAFADAALAVAGHEVTDPVVRSIAGRVARREISGDLAVAMITSAYSGLMLGQHAFRTWDDYYIPGTTALRNKFVKPGEPYGEDDPARLEELEIGVVMVRLLELDEHPIGGGFDYAHMKAIHRFLFQDVYEWAGQERVAPVGQYMTKMGPDVVHYAVGDPNAPVVARFYSQATGSNERLAEVLGRGIRPFMRHIDESES